MKIFISPIKMKFLSGLHQNTRDPFSQATPETPEVSAEIIPFYDMLKANAYRNYIGVILLMESQRKLQ
jgi:hypothetical protein